VEVIEARYGGRPAYIGAFLRDGGVPNTLVIWVVSRTTCKLLSTVQQSLR
jgi:hypothetical protein